MTRWRSRVKRKKAPGAFDLLRPESFSCDRTVLSELLSICAYGMPAVEVRFSVAAPVHSRLNCLGARVAMEGFQQQNTSSLRGRSGEKY